MISTNVEIVPVSKAKSPAERQKAQRRRDKMGAVWLGIEVAEHPFAQALLDDGFAGNPEDLLDRRVLAREACRILARWTASILNKKGGATVTP